jgi:integrase/recombinase XerD
VAHRLTDLVATFTADRKASGYAVRTLEGNAKTLGRLLAFLAEREIERIDQVTPAALADYQAHLAAHGGVKGRPLTLHSQANLVGLVRTFFRFVVVRQYALTNPAQLLAVPHLPERLPERILDHASVKKLLLAPDVTTPLGVRDRAMIELFYSTGLRVSELTALDVSDIDLADGELSVRRGKGGKGRRIPVGAAACQWVSRYLRDARPALVRKRSERVLFLSKRGRALARGDVASVVRTLARAAGLRIRVTPHTIRHTFATHMLRGKASLRHIQDMLGHALLSTTQIYTRVDISDLKDVHRRCHPRGRS